jgi:hypothetical protein
LIDALVSCCDITNANITNAKMKIHILATPRSEPFPSLARPMKSGAALPSAWRNAMMRPSRRAGVGLDP